MVTFNGVDRLIEITDPGDVVLDVERDIYSAWKDWSQIGDNSKYAPAFFSFGGNSTAPGQTAPKYFFLQNFWRVYVNNGQVVSIALNLYTENYPTPYIVALGSGVSDRNSDAVNVNELEVKRSTYTDNKVYINTLGGGLPGVIYPRGNPSNPSDNFTDAQIIASSNGFNEYDVLGPLSLLITDNLDRVHFHGHGHNNTTITLNGGSSVSAVFDDLTLTGTLNGAVDINNSEVLNLTEFEGTVKNSGLLGDLTIGASCTGLISLINCYSQIAGTGRPKFDINGSACDLSVRNYAGGLTVAGMTQNTNTSIDVLSGTIEIDATCTAGTINVRGVCNLIDNSGAGCTVVRSGTVTDLTWNAQTSEYQVPGSAGEAISSGGALTVDQATQLSELWQILGLDNTNPVTMEVTQHTVGGITLDVVCNPDSSVTITRQ